MSDRVVIEPDLEFIHAVQKSGGESLKKCYQCATCSVVCELSPTDKPFPRKEMIWAQWGLKDQLISDPDIWLCHQCNDCSTQCPRNARPGDVLAGIRNYIYQSFAFPRFMGKAMANPAALPFLFLVPMILIAALMGYKWTAEGWDWAYFMNGDVRLTEFVPAGLTEMFFIFGNILVFAIAFIGLARFWKGLNHDAVGGPKMSFMAALMSTIAAIITHKHFEGCGQNKPRRIAHMLVLFGFFGAAATAGLALFFGHLAEMWHLPFAVETPLDFWKYEGYHAVIQLVIKVIGAGSGIAIFIGGTMLLVRRNNKMDDVGADGYPDRLFLQLVFWTGLTGMLSWILRLTGIGYIAYPMYYIHISTVFVILWYMPYSKFAHMLYRTMALVWAEQRGRTLCSVKTKQLAATEAAAS